MRDSLYSCAAADPALRTEQNNEEEEETDFPCNHHKRYNVSIIYSIDRENSVIESNHHHKIVFLSQAPASEGGEGGGNREHGDSSSVHARTLISSCLSSYPSACRFIRSGRH